MNGIPEGLEAALAERYELLSTIGRGGMAAVYLARDRKHDRHVAVKVLRRELAASLGKDRFLNEIEIAARLTHPHIVSLHDSGDARGFLFYVMPYVDGESLRGLLKRERYLTPLEAADIALQVADALGYAHREGVLHRDIKPENILLSQGHAFVVDFGVAKALSSAGGPNLTRTGFALGTPGYMSPEQAAGVRDLDERTDVYGLACVVYEALVGEPPGLWLTEEAVRLGRFVDAESHHREQLDGLPGRLEQVLARALAMRRDDRFTTPVEFVEAFVAVTGSAGAGPRYSDADLRRVIQRAAELQAKYPTEEGVTFSVGGVEQIGAQVGIPPGRVREAMAELDPRLAEPTAPTARPPQAWPAPITVRVDRTVDGEVTEELYETMVQEMRRTLGTIGNVARVGRSLVWSSSAPGGVGRNVRVAVTPQGGNTSIHLEEMLATSAAGSSGASPGSWWAACWEAPRGSPSGRRRRRPAWPRSSGLASPWGAPSSCPAPSAPTPRCSGGGSSRRWRGGWRRLRWAGGRANCPAEGPGRAAAAFPIPPLRFPDEPARSAAPAFAAAESGSGNPTIPLRKLSIQ